MLRFSLAFLVALASTDSTDAANRRRTPVRQPLRYATPQQPLVHSNPTISTAAGASTVISTNATDALDELNAQRAARGLRPYLRDHNLTLGAMNVAKFRAERRMQGHTKSDFSGLPLGTTAAAAGCAAWPPSLGWGSCCTYENHRFAGAAWAMGADGLRYMQLFVK